MLGALVLALLQQPVVAYSSPPGGDTTGYWQQRASYTVVATLDEATDVLHATATLTYVNNSPDTLREFYVHQHLNAFRPGSKWSAVDEREGRTRFQNLRDPDYAYERFTAVPTFDGTPVPPEYPGAPDSTVARFALPRALPPGDTLRVTFAWDARPSTLPRRQGRRGRSFDFAQWYPRVAVYDRDGWRPYPLRPAGEFYGEFGDWDVTLLVRDDQVIGTTGLVVEGDPGWARALEWGVVARQPNGYGYLAPAPATTVPAGFKRVRVVARDVHHFGWSTSPDYRYEGAWYLRAAPVRDTRFRVWDSVAVHVLYRPGDEREWGNGQVAARTNVTLRWLESIFGPYAYPQMTVLHRIEGGGTEFPMLQMNGSASQGLNLHEGGHVFAHGILASNEWRAGWLDEGLSSYQTAWAQRLTPQDPPYTPATATAEASTRPAGYAGLAVRPEPALDALTAQARLDLLGRTQPLGLSSEDFRDFGTYNAMVYGRASRMYGALRDAIGDAAFSRFLELYYDRWALRHVDEVAMRAAAESAAGADLDWFFAQWVHRTGVVDYSLTDVHVRPEGDAWVTSGRVERRASYRHPMPLGALTDSGWTLARGDALADEQWITVRTATRPQAVRLDPLRTTPDWYVPNNVDAAFPLWNPATSRVVFDWPVLEQRSADRIVTAIAPLAWYSRPNGLVGAVRIRASYLGLFDRAELGLAFASRTRPARTPPLGDRELRYEGVPAHLQGWLTFENPMFGGGRPLMGLSGGVWYLDGLAKTELAQRWERTLPAGDRRTHALSFTGTYPIDRALLDGRRWSGRSASDLTWSYERVAPASRGMRRWQLALTGGALVGEGVNDGDGDALPYARGEASWSIARRSSARRLSHHARLYAAASLDVPPERAIYLSAATPTATFASHFWRPDGGVFSSDKVNYRPLGGAGLRGYDPFVAATHAAAVNVEEALRIARFGPTAHPLDVELTLFGDAGVRWLDVGSATTRQTVADAGVGFALRGQLFDRPLRVRLDVPLYVRDPALAVGARGHDALGDHRVRLRWAFSLNDLW